MSGMKTGAFYNDKEGSCLFVVWAPLSRKVELKIVYPGERSIPMQKDEPGYWRTRVEAIIPGTRYLYRVDERNDLPDPASFHQPEGVHGASAVIDHSAVQWSDAAFIPPPLEDLIFYEIHTGTFTSSGTFASAVERLDYLLDLGITVLEIMPVAQFPGSRNWGYDGAYLYAVQDSYGGPNGLKLLVNECHKRGMAVCLDVVYNHFGPEGNYLSLLCPYFTDRYCTPWGAAVNFDDAYSYGVRDFVVENVLYWFEHFHIDMLRLDAIHGIFDSSAKHILREMSEAVEKYCEGKNRTHYLIAESDLNDTRVITPVVEGGYGIHAQWSDDFHHAMHVLLTGEDSVYYEDFGRPEDLLKAINEGFVYSWDFSNYRKRYHGSSSAGIPHKSLVIFIQNHDQIGNRKNGERLSVLVDFEALKLAAAVMLTAPYIPLLFMGEEYAEDNPFLYFVSYGDENLIESVRQGRRREFEDLDREQDPPDPQNPDTFKASIPDYTKAASGDHLAMRGFYKTLITLRKNDRCLSDPDTSNCLAERLEDLPVIVMHRYSEHAETMAIFNYSGDHVRIRISAGVKRYVKRIDSADGSFNGPGSDAPEILYGETKMMMKPYQFILYGARRQ
jgi:maltooligosyltrehalose trehalohydrolase